LYPISYYAMAAQRYVERYPDGRAAMAEAAVLARQWALANPVAWRHGDGPLSTNDVLDAAEVSSPLGQLDCCLVTDGGGAIVVTSADRARDLARPPIAVLGIGEHTTNNSMTAHDDLLQPGCEVAAGRAFAAAGLSLADVDLAEIYDSFTITVVLTLEALGLCTPGEAYGLLASGDLAPGGRLPLNTTGGGLSYCHPGQLGVLLLVEAVRQLRGDAGDRQVPGAEVALVHGTGGIFSTHATVLLGAAR
jgi:acetyl-CoA acetyltransferase